ncbi:hypothetical protein BBJ28_00018704, partial [Nothophytophthora sp. Chile5]
MWGGPLTIDDASVSMQQLGSTMQRSGVNGFLRGAQQHPALLRQALQSTRSHTFLRKTNAEKPLSWATWLSENIPKGFGRFYPKNGNGAATGAKAGAPKAAPKVGEKGNVKKLSSKGAESKAGGSGGSGGSSGGSGGPSGKDGMAYLVPVAVAALFLSDLASVDKPMQEITYQEFRNSFLESGRVDKLVVINKKYVKVFLNDMAGASATSGAVPGGNQDFSDWHDPNAKGQHEYDFSAQPDQHAGGGRSPTLPSAGASRSGRPISNPVYYFNIGSVENFERQLEHAQHQMGIRPHDYIPVQYSNEISVTSELLKFLPTIVLIGFLLMTMRGMGGGAGGGGGMSNIFKVGKSPAKKITKEDIKISFKDVAGVDEAKKEIMEFVDFLRNQKRFTELGAKI